MPLSDPIRFLFVKTKLAYPRAAGHDIRAYNLMRALGQLGHTVALTTVDQPSPDATAGLSQVSHRLLSGAPSQASDTVAQTWLQRRYASYFGVPLSDAQAVGALADEQDADVVVGVGADILPYLTASHRAKRVWYAGDEWVSHYLSLWRPARRDTYVHLKDAAIWGVYQRAHVSRLDRVWVVSAREAAAMKMWAGASNVDAIPNGVDTDYYSANGTPERPNTAIFWGRLDFGPNIQALDWFCRQVWPRLRERHADAAFNIVGFAPGEAVHALSSLPGVTVVPDVPDIRAAVGTNAVVVLPFHSGGGIKNKLLEAASMRKAIVCTGLACGGLRGRPPVVLAERPDEWVTAIAQLWASAPQRQALADAARTWVATEHSWNRTAVDAVASLQRESHHA